MKTAFPLAALAATLAALPAQAQNKMEEVVVTSSRVEMPLRKLGTSVSIMEASEIEALGFNSLHDALRTQPAVAVSNSGGAGATTTLRIRGEEGFRTRTYIDGIDISDTSAPQVSPRFEHIMSAGIGRVEILRGPQGMMYGADAGGIVNITTTQYDEGFGGAVNAEAGRYGTQQLGAHIGGGNNTVDFALSLADFQTDGFNARSDETQLRDNDGYDNTTVHARLGWNVTETFRLSLVARDVDGRGEYDNCFDASFARSEDCDSDYEQQALRVAADATTGAFEHQLAYTASETERQDYTDGLPTFFGDGELERISYVGRFSGGDALGLVYGVDLQREALDNGSVDRERDQDGYYVEYQGQLTPAFFLTAGLRYDDNEDFGDYTTYRVSGAYIIPMDASELKLKGTYGTGFRAPSLFEISYNAGPFAAPPASLTDLEPEESEGYDLGVVWATDNGLLLEATWFDQEVTNEIFFDSVASSGYLQGDGSILSRGVELIAEIPVGDSLELTGNYTYNDSENAGGGNRVRRPKYLANAGVQWRPLDERLVLGLTIRGSYDAVDIDGSALDDYTVVNANASFEVIRGLSLYGRVENLLDEDYEEVPGFKTAGAAAYAGVRYRF